MMRSFHLFLRLLVIFKTRILNKDQVMQLVCPKAKQMVLVFYWKIIQTHREKRKGENTETYCTEAVIIVSKRPLESRAALVKYNYILSCYCCSAAADSCCFR